MLAGVQGLTVSWYLLHISICGPPWWADPLHYCWPICFLRCPPVALHDGLMPQCEHAGWSVQINCQPILSIRVYLWPSLMGQSPTLESAHTIPMVSCGPPGWAHASVRTYWLEHKGELSANAFFTCLSVALLNGPIPYHDVGPYGSYMPSAEIRWHRFYAKSTRPLQRIIPVMWLKDVGAQNQDLAKLARLCRHFNLVWKLILVDCSQSLDGEVVSSHPQKGQILFLMFLYRLLINKLNAKTYLPPSNNISVSSSGLLG